MDADDFLPLLEQQLGLRRIALTDEAHDYLRWKITNHVHSRQFVLPDIDEEMRNSSRKLADALERRVGSKAEGVLLIDLRSVIDSLCPGLFPIC